MRYLILLPLFLMLSIAAKAQQTPREEYTEFAHFQQDDSFTDYIAGHVKKPDIITADIKGIFSVTLLIDSTGKASVFRIQKTISPEVDAEFTKAIAASPLWKPANFNGHPVMVYFTMQIGVELNKATSTMTTDPSVSAVYTATKVAPKFPGGEAALKTFLASHTHYPAEAKQKNVSGVVFVQFVVETDGSLTDIKILREPGYGLGDAVIKALTLSPKWQPGILNNKPVRTQFTLPFSFNMQ